MENQNKIFIIHVALIQNNAGVMQQRKEHYDVAHLWKEGAEKQARPVADFNMHNF